MRSIVTRVIVAVAAATWVLLLCVSTGHAGAGDIDNDWCTDEQEVGALETQGGRRDSNNLWDYFNPSHDRRNRADDIGLVVNQFFVDSGNPNYTINTDRTLIGPDRWDLGPPNGWQRVDDIIFSVNHFFHDCPFPHSHSWSISNPDSAVLESLGHNDGVFDNATCSDSLVVLDFGQPDFQAGTYGTNHFGSGAPFISNQEIVAATLNYADGWYHATGICPKLKLVVGTNNTNMIPSGGGTPAGAGNALADVVTAVQNYLNAAGWGSQITAWAGSDMEQPDGSVPDWDCAVETIQFVYGYNGNPDARHFVNYGTAWVPHACWTAADVHYVSYGAPHNYPLPEIYTTYATDSWVSVRTAQGYMFFDGVMSYCLSDPPNSALLVQWLFPVQHLEARVSLHPADSRIYGESLTTRESDNPHLSTARTFRCQ